MRTSTTILIGLLASTCVCAAAGAAGAADTPPAKPGASNGPLTRAEVKAETLRALAAHEVVFGETAYPRQPDRVEIGSTASALAKSRTAATR